MFHPIQINHPTKKTIPGEWLGFSGQDARKSRFWTTRNSAKQKDFLVRLSSLKDELAHRAPMLLKSQNVIVRQISGPEAGEMNIVALLFGAQSLSSIPIASPKAPQILLAFQKYPKERFSSWTLAGALLFAPAHEKLKIHP